MAKRSFSADAFNKASSEVAGGKTGDFPTIEKGTYLADVAKVSFKFTEKGAEQASIGFQIDSEDETYPNQYIWWNQTLININGDDNTIGLRLFVTMLNQLTDNHCDKTMFADPNTRDNEFEKLLGTRVKIHVIPKQDGQYINYDIKVRALLENVYAKERQNELDEDDVPFETEKDSSDTLPVEEPEKKKSAKLEVGMKIQITTIKNGVSVVEQGTCIQFIDTGDEDSMIVMQPDAKHKPAKAFKPSEVEKVKLVEGEDGNPVWNEEFIKQQKLGEEGKEEKEEQVEEIEEVNEWELTLKGSAAFNHPTLGRISGLVKAILEDEGKAVIASNGKNYKVPIAKLEKP